MLYLGGGADRDFRMPAASAAEVAGESSSLAENFGLGHVARYCHGMKVQVRRDVTERCSPRALTAVVRRGQLALRYAPTERYTKTTAIPVSQATLCQAWRASGPPSASERISAITIVTGWFVAKA